MREKGPPPINYATHPRRSALTEGTQTASTAVTTPQPPPMADSLSNSNPNPQAAAIAIDWEWLNFLIHSATTRPNPDALLVTQTVTATSSIVDAHDCTQVDSLADGLDGLSTNDDLEAHVTQQSASPPLSLPASVVHARPRHCKARYYSVVVGKCCGVYKSWSTVHPLVIGVSGSVYTGFRSYEGALWDYQTAKAAGNVRPVREPGDELIYGPLSGACM